MYKICPVCGKPILQVNLELHQVHCEKLHAAEPTRSAKQAASSTKPSGASNTKKKAKKTGETRSLKTECTDDLDAMLAELSLSDSTCSHQGCSKSVNVLGLLCQFCRQRFCMAHSIAEVHGCSEAAKDFARQRLRQELKDGHSTRPKTVDTAKRNQLQRKLDKKIKSLSKERRGSSTK